MPFASCNNVDVTNKSVFWHNRLGHHSLSRMHCITTSASDVSFSISNFPMCSVCPIAKQKRLPFSNENHVCSLVFDLIYCDIWGPFSVLSLNGFKYFLTIIDDCNRCTWVYLMKFKSDT